MRRALAPLLIGAALLAGIPAEAFWNSRGSDYNVSVGPTYPGPGDIVGSASAWYGVRGYSAAYAAPGTGKSVNVRRASDNTTQDIVILATGAFDLAGFNAFVGTDATASCTIAGTAMACSGATATLHVGDIISGVGISQPCLVTVTNGSTTATASLAGTSTTCGTVGVAETVTFQVAGLVTTAYNQSGGSLGNVVQATAANQPQLLPNCGNTLPCMYFLSTVPQSLSLATFTTVAQPWSFSAVGNGLLAQPNTYIATQSSFSNYIVNPAGNFANPLSGAGNTVLNSSVTGVLGTLYAAQFVGNGASGAINVGGADTTGTSGATSASQPLYLGIAGAASPLKGYLDEAGLWPSAFSLANRNAVCANQRAYWTTAGSC